MKRFHASALISGAMALIFTVLLSMNVYAASSEVVEGTEGGPGVAYDTEGNVINIVLGESAVSLVEADDTAAQEASVTKSGMTEISVDGTIFTHDGVSYTKGEYYGNVRLTGYSAEKLGNVTASGAEAREGHTISASSDLPFGTVVILSGVTGPNAEDYTGVYVVEDRGGGAIEDGKVIDLFFESQEDAMRVTDNGWNYADIWIAVPV